MDEGDRTINKIGDKCIMMVGLTRSGKSTSYNWVLGKQMKGAKVDGYIVYELTGGDDAAPIAPGMKSITMVPNTFEIDGK